MASSSSPLRAQRTTKAQLEAELARVKHELSVVVSTRHKEASASAIGKQRAHYEKGMRRYAKGVQKYRAQQRITKGSQVRNSPHIRSCARLREVAFAAERLRRDMAGDRAAIAPELDYAPWVEAYDALDDALAKLLPEDLTAPKGNRAHSGSEEWPATK